MLKSTRLLALALAVTALAIVGAFLLTCCLLLVLGAVVEGLTAGQCLVLITFAGAFPGVLDLLAHAMHALLYGDPA